MKKHILSLVVSIGLLMPIMTFSGESLSWYDWAREQFARGSNYLSSYIPQRLKNIFIYYKQSNIDVLASFFDKIQKVGGRRFSYDEFARSSLYKEFITSIYPIIIRLNPPPQITMDPKLKEFETYRDQTNIFWNNFFDVINKKNSRNIKIQKSSYDIFKKALADCLTIYTDPKNNLTPTEMKKCRSLRSSLAAGIVSTLFDYWIYMNIYGW